MRLTVPADPTITGIAMGPADPTVTGLAMGPAIPISACVRTEKAWLLTGNQIERVHAKS